MYLCIYIKKNLKDHLRLKSLKTLRMWSSAFVRKTEINFLKKSIKAFLLLFQASKVVIVPVWKNILTEEEVSFLIYELCLHLKSFETNFSNKFLNVGALFDRASNQFI